MTSKKSPRGFLVQAWRSDPLFAAAEAGDTEQIARALDRGGIDVNSRDFKRQATPLMRAAAGSHHDAVSFLLSRGASAELSDDVGWNALTWCCWGAGQGRGWVHGLKGTYSVINMLINEAGPVTVERRTSTGHTPLMMLVKYMGRRGTISARKLANDKGVLSAAERAYSLTPREEQENAVTLMLSSVQSISLDGKNGDPQRTRRLLEAKNQYGEGVLDLCRRRDIRRLIIGEFNRIPRPDLPLDDDMDLPSIVDGKYDDDDAESARGGSSAGGAGDRARGKDKGAGAGKGGGFRCCSGSGSGPGKPRRQKKTGNKYADSPYFAVPQYE